jgi:signal transduction histidine kinase
VARFLRGAEERTVPSGAARIADVAIAVVATIIAIVSVLEQTRGPGGAIVVFPTPGGKLIHYSPGHVTNLSAGALLGAALTTTPLAFRRMYPITAFCVILGAVIGTSAHATTITFAAAIFAAYSAVAYSRFRQLALLSVLAGAVVVTAAYPDTTPPVPERFTALLILLPTVSVGAAIRVWRGRARESAERLRRAEAGHEEQTRRAVEVERARIASEMHDVVTHNVSVMVVQAGAARRVLDSSPGDARGALLAVEASGRTAMTELRHLLGLLAPAGDGGFAEPGAGPGDAAAPGRTDQAQQPDGAGHAVLAQQPDGAGHAVLAQQPDGAGHAVLAQQPDGAGHAVLAQQPDGAGHAVLAPQPDGAGHAVLAPQPGLGQVGMLVDRVRAAGRPAELSVAGGRDLPPGLDLAAYRVVQEALTNVIKHAGQARTTVRIEYRQAELLITVCDDGSSAAAATGRGGRGLIGLRERIAVYGGELDAGPRPGGGWRLAARIPLEPLPVAPETRAVNGADPGPVPPEFWAVSS